MSEEEGGFGASAIEKLFGLLVFLMGIMTMYYSLTSAAALMAFTGFFGFLSLILIIIGIVLIIAKVE
jgi:hypothetical protein